MIQHIEGKSRGYFPVYWELFDDDKLNQTEILFLSYLIEIYPVLKKSIEYDGRLYKRLADDYIQNKFDASRNTIRKWFNTLESLNYIAVYHEEDNKAKARYFTILLEIDDPVNSGYYSGNECGEDCGNYREQYRGEDCGNYRGQNLTTKETKTLKEKDTNIVVGDDINTTPIDKSILNSLSNKSLLIVNKYISKHLMPETKVYDELDTFINIDKFSDEQIYNIFRDACKYDWKSLWNNSNTFNKFNQNKDIDVMHLPSECVTEDKLARDINGNLIELEM